jgi:hypothetical protein
MRIDASGNLLVGTTSESTWESAKGFRARQSGSTTITRDGNPPLYVNRLTSDGDIAVFKKGTTTVGSIGSSFGNRLYIGDGDTAIRFADDLDTIVPWNGSTNTLRDDAIDLGESSGRFKDLYLSGTARSNTVSINGTTVIDSSRNLTNIGTISSLAITSSGLSYLTQVDSSEFRNTTRVSTATTPANTAGWFKIAKVVRGAGRILLSFTGGNHSPDTYVIDYYKNWSTTGSLFLKNLQGVSYITKAKIRQDSGDSNYYVEIYCASNSNGLSFQVYHQRLQGFANSGNEVYGGSLSAGSTSGTDIVSEQSFVPKGIWTEGIEADYYYGDVNILTGALKINGQPVINSSRNLTVGTISSGAITSTGEVEATALDINGNGDISGNLTLGGYLAGPATFTIDPAAVGDNTGTVVIAGNLQVDGTTTTINSTTLTVDDKNITLASGSANAAAANGAGLTVDCGSGTDATFTYDGTNDEWDFNKDINVTGTISSAGGTMTGALNIGAAIGSRATTLSIEGDSNSSPFAVKCSDKATVFSVLPWSGGETYIASGVYYDDGSWVHASADATNCLIALDGSGVSWYSSNNSSGSWNVADNVSLWNSSGSWVGGIASSGYNNSNWDTAYSWGNHASANYLTSFDITTQTDPKYLRSDANDTFTGTLTTGELQIFSSHPVHTGYSGIANTEAWTTTTEQYMIISAGTDTYINGDSVIIRAGNNSSTNEMTISTSGTTIGGNTVWHAGNDGSGSTLDADKLDGSEGAVYFKSPSDVSGWQNSNRNFSVRSGGNAVGLHMEESDGTFGFQLYGDSGAYGFLDGEWASWDIRKVVNGAFSVDEGAGLKRVLNEANWSSYVTSVSGTSGGLSGSPNITVGTISSGAISSTGNLDVDGIIDNTRNNGNVSAPNNSNHTAGTRIKFYDAGATAWYAMGIESMHLWFTSDGGYKWYEDSVERMTLSSGGNLSLNSGNLTIKGNDGFNATGETASIYLGDGNSEIRATYDGGTKFFLNGTDRMEIEGGTGNLNLKTGNLEINSTTVIDSSRNLRSIPLQNLGSPLSNTEHAVVNIGRVGGAGETRAIDIWGSWSAGESKSITAVHGSSSAQIVGQINFIHDSPGSRMRFGKLYQSGDSSVYPMILDSSSTTGASLDVTNDQHSTGNANRTFGTATSRKKKGAFHVKGGQGGISGNAYVTGITFPGADEDETQAGLYCSQNSSTGTSLSLMCTDSYNNGPKEYFTVLDSGYCKVMANTLDVYDQVYANTKGSHFLIMGDAAYSTSSNYIGMKTSFQSGANDYMIISGVSDGETYVSAKDGSAVTIRGGGNRSSNQITVPDGTTITATTSDFRVTGNVTAYASDARLKTNIKTIKNPIEKIKKIRGVEFDWLDNIENFNPKHKHETGVIAQEIEEVIPDAVSPAPFNEEYKTVDKEKIVALLIEAIKDQQKEIEYMKSEIETLKENNNGN